MHYGNTANPLNLDVNSMSNPAFVLRNFAGTMAPGNSVLVKITVTSGIGTAQHKTRTAVHSMVAAGDQMIPVSSPDFSGIDWSDVDRISLSLINSGSGGNQWDIQGFCVRASSNPTPKMGTALAQNVRLYPVPAADRLHVEWIGTSNQTVALSILDLQGRVVAVQTERAEGEMHTFDLDVAPLANGIYTLVVESNGTTETRRFSVHH